MFSTILVPVDLADPAVAAVAMAEARRIARRDGARIAVISIVPAWPDDLAKTPGDWQPRLDAYIEENRDGLDVEGILKVGGSIAGRIEEAAEEIRADLVVMASHDPRMTDYVIGSNAAHVVLHTPTSVLVVRGRAEDAGPRRHILVPVDLDSPEAPERALALAAGTARAEGARLTVVSVQPIVADQTAMPPPDYQPRLDALVARVARDHGVEAEGMLKVGGSVSGEIRYAAEELDVDLIVMASHEPRLTDYLIGSNAAHVALHTPASVLVVR